MHSGTSPHWVYGPDRAHAIHVYVDMSKHGIQMKGKYIHIHKCKAAYKTNPSFTVWQNPFLIMQFKGRDCASILQERRKSRAHPNFRGRTEVPTQADACTACTVRCRGGADAKSCTYWCNCRDMVL